MRPFFRESARPESVYQHAHPVACARLVIHVLYSNPHRFCHNPSSQVFSTANRRHTLVYHLCACDTKLSVGAGGRMWMSGGDACVARSSLLLCQLSKSQLACHSERSEESASAC